jgi:hypothetical protein
VANEVREWLAPLAASGTALDPAALAVDVGIEAANGGYRVVGGTGVGPSDRDPLAVAVAAVTAEAVTRSPLLCVHAAVVSHPGGILAAPGRSGHGKSTLTAALLSAGFGYVSDEALALDRRHLQVSPFPRPLALGAEVWPLLGLDLARRPGPGRERFVPAAELGHLGRSGAVSHVLLTRRDDTAATVVPVARAAAVTALLANSFNHYRDAESSFRVAVRVARSATVWSARYRDADRLAALLAEKMLTPETNR